MITREDLIKRVAAAMQARDSLAKASIRNVALATKNTALLVFQQADGSLDKDGLYGPNSKAALAWYLQTSSNKSVPDVNPRFAKSARTGLPIAVTWKAPELVPSPVTSTSTSTPASASAPASASMPATASASVSRPAPGALGTVGSMSAASRAQREILHNQRIERSRRGASIRAARASAPTIASVVKKVSKAVGPLPKFGQELLAQNIGKVDAEDVIAAVASGAPKIKKALKTMDAESNIAREFAKIQSKGLKGIKKTLLRGAVQREATSEHKSLANRDNFRQTVLSQLKDIRSQLAAKKAGKGGEDYRIVGLLL